MLGILKVQTASSRNLLAFSLMLFEGKKGLELLKMPKGLKVVLILLVRKTGGWFLIFKKLLKLEESIQIWVKSADNHLDQVQ